MFNSSCFIAVAEVSVRLEPAGMTNERLDSDKNKAYAFAMVCFRPLLVDKKHLPKNVDI